MESFHCFGDDEDSFTDQRKKCIQVLLEAGADVNADYNDDTALNLAAGYSVHGAVELLLRAGADVNKVPRNGITPLMETLQSHWKGDPDYQLTDGDIKCINVLLEAGADVNIECEDHTALTVAVKYGLYDLLIQAGADVKKVLRNGITPLVEASRSFALYSHVFKCLETLIQAGADVNVITSEGSALFVAVEGLSDECVALLIKAGADVNKFSSVDGWATPLMEMTSKGFLTTVELLLKAGANANLADCDGNTALMGICSKSPFFKSDEDGVDCIGCTKTLLRYGVKINMRNKKSENPLEQFVALYQGCSSLPEFDGNCRLLFAAGETIDGIPNAIIPDCLKFKDVKLKLKHICREAIRKHLLKLDMHTHLFGRMPELGLPSLLTEYLLFDTSLDDVDDNSSDHSDSDDDSSSSE